MGISDGRELDPCRAHQVYHLIFLKPPIIDGFLIKCSAWIRRRERNLDCVRINLFGVSDSLLDRFMSFARESKNECSVNLDSKLPTILTETPRHISAQTLFYIKQNLVVAGLKTDQQQSKAIVLHDLESGI